MQHKVENLVVSSIRNDWGWYAASAFVDNTLVSVRYDRKPRSKKQVREDLIRVYEELRAGKSAPADP